MRFALVLAVFAAAFGCGKEIGDDCVVSSDCSPNGDRICDTSSPSGYCTIQGCDFDNCPEEAVCVRFFTGNFSNRACDPTTETGDGGPNDKCTFDELCSLMAQCVPRASELRYCMRKCDSNGDCRDNYECRDLQRMKEVGGEPVLAPGTPIGDNPPKFCAPAAR